MPQQIYHVGDDRHEQQRCRQPRMSLDGVVPVIFMTGYSAGMAQDRFLEDVGAALIQKPYSVETLGLKVREVLDVRRTVARRKESVPRLA